MNKYKVIADYRPNNPKKPHYYVNAKTKKDAKKWFENTYVWLKVYEVEEIEHDITLPVNKSGRNIELWKHYYDKFKDSKTPLDLALSASWEIKMAIFKDYGTIYFKCIIDAIEDVCEEHGWDVLEVIKDEEN